MNASLDVAKQVVLILQGLLLHVAQPVSRSCCLKCYNMLQYFPKRIATLYEFMRRMMYVICLHASGTPLRQARVFMHGPSLSEELTLKGTPLQLGESEQSRQQLPPKKDEFFQTSTA